MEWVNTIVLRGQTFTKMFAARFYNIFTIGFLHYLYDTFYNMFRKVRVYNGFYNISL